MCLLIYSVIRFFIELFVGIFLAAAYLFLFLFKHKKLFIYGAYFGYFFLSTGSSMDALYTTAEVTAVSTSNFINSDLIDVYNDFAACLVLPRRVYNQNVALVQAILGELASEVGIYVFRDDVSGPPDERTIAADLCSFVEYVFTFVREFFILFGDFVAEFFDILETFIGDIENADFIDIFVQIIQDALLSLFGPAKCFLPISQINQRFFGCLCTNVYDSYTDVSTNPFNALGGCICGTDFDITGDFLNDIIYPCFRIEEAQGLMTVVQSGISEAYQDSVAIGEDIKDINGTLAKIQYYVGEIEDGIGDILDDLCDLLGCRAAPDGGTFVRRKDGSEFYVSPRSPPFDNELLYRQLETAYSLHKQSAAQFPPPVPPLPSMPQVEYPPPYTYEQPTLRIRDVNLTYASRDHKIAANGARILLEVAKDTFRDMFAAGQLIDHVEIQQRIRARGLKLGEMSRAVIRASRGPDWAPVCAMRSRSEILKYLPPPPEEYSTRIIPILILGGTLAGTAACACVVAGSCLATTLCGVCCSTIVILLIPFGLSLLGMVATAGNDFFYIIIAGGPRNEFSQDFVSDWVEVLAPYIDNTLYTGFAPIDLEEMFSAFGSLFIKQAEYVATDLLRQFMCNFPRFGDCPPRPYHFDTPQDYVFGLLQCHQGAPCGTVNDCRSRVGTLARAKECRCDGRVADFWSPCNGTTPGKCHCWPYAVEDTSVSHINITAIFDPDCESLGWMYKHIMPYQGASWWTMIKNWSLTTKRTIKLFTNIYSTGLSIPWVFLFVFVFLSLCRCTRRIAVLLTFFTVATNIVSLQSPKIADSFDSIADSWPFSYFSDDVYYFTKFPNATPGNRGHITFAEGQCAVLTLAQTIIITEVSILTALLLLDLIKTGVVVLIFRAVIGVFNRIAKTVFGWFGIEY